MSLLSFVSGMLTSPKSGNPSTSRTGLGASILVVLVFLIEDTVHFAITGEHLEIKSWEFWVAVITALAGSYGVMSYSEKSLPLREPATEYGAKIPDEEDGDV